MRLSLPSVSLVAVSNEGHEAVTKSAIQFCTDVAEFHEVLHFVQSQVVDQKSYSDFLWYGMPCIVKSSHILIVQWDSWIIDPEMWSDEFLKYDYIGAPWNYTDGFNVGNGGFSLRSLKLMRHLMFNREKYPCGDLEDDLICRKYREQLEERGFLWAPDDVALSFSFERIRPDLTQRHFGFHGVFNFPLVLGNLLPQGDTAKRK